MQPSHTTHISHHIQWGNTLSTVCKWPPKVYDKTFKETLSKRELATTHLAEHLLHSEETRWAVFSSSHSVVKPRCDNTVDNFYIGGDGSIWIGLCAFSQRQWCHIYLLWNNRQQRWPCTEKCSTEHATCPSWQAHLSFRAMSRILCYHCLLQQSLT